MATRKPARIRLAPGEVASQPPLADAAIAGDARTVRRLLAGGADPSAWWKRRHRGQAVGRTDVLEATVDAGQPRTALILVEAMAELPARSRFGATHPAVGAAWRRFGELGDTVHRDRLDDLGKAILASQRGRAPKPGELADWRRLVLAMLGHGGLPSGGALCHAACWQDSELLQRLLDAGVEQDGLVRAAIRRGWCDILDLLAARGNRLAPAAVSEAAAKLGFGARVDDFPLLQAIEFGRPEVVAAVLRAKPDLAATASSGVHALLWAAMHDAAEPVRLLLAAGADPEQPGTFHHLHLRLPVKPGDPLRIDTMQAWARVAGTTPLIVAVRRGRDEVVAALLDGKADANRCDAEGLSPLAWAVRLGHEAIAGRLRAAGAADGRDRGTPAHAMIAAAGRGDLAEVKRLAARRKLVEACEEQELRQVTPLVAAAGSGHEAVVRALLAAGADPARKLSLDGWRETTALLVAAAAGHTACCLAMIRAGADPRASCGGENALHNAARHGHAATVTALVKQARVPVDLPALEGGSALALAAAQRHPATVEALLALGADPNLRQEDGTVLEAALFGWPEANERTPEAMAACRACVRLLLAAGADVRYRPRRHGWPCLSPAVQNDLELTRMLLDAGADYDASSSLGFPLLHACSEGRMDTARLLLERGASVNQRSEDGWSAVLWAAAHGPDFTRLLLDAGADPHAATDDGFNLVWSACRSAQFGQPNAMVEALVAGAERVGARAEVVTGSGQTEEAALATLRLVIAAGADPLARYEGKTPLQDKDIPEAMRAAIAQAAGVAAPAARRRKG